MSVGEFLGQLTGSRAICSSAARIEAKARYAIATLQLWRERGRQRRALGRLDAQLLRDIGCSQADVMREQVKPVWRA